jgi:hypothetical protein
MMGLFKPHGVAPKWQLISEYMQICDADYIASLDELAMVAECKPENISSLMVIVNKHLHDDGVRFVSIRGEGYRKATPSEAIYEATERRPRAFMRTARRAKQATIAARHHPDASPLDKKRADESALILDELQRNLRKGRKQLRKFTPELPMVVRGSNEDVTPKKKST